MALQMKSSVLKYAGVFLVAFAVILLRRPDAVLNAQFLYEDGPIWYADAYNHGWLRALVITHGGYLQTLPRIEASIALLFPFRLAPLVQNLIAAAFQTAPVLLLLSTRSETWGSLRFRFFLALSYLLLPNTRDMISTITESQWFLALIALLILVAAPATSKLEHWLDVAIVGMCGISGPFCVFLFPVAAYQFARKIISKSLFAVLTAGCCIQTVTFLFAHNTRPRPALGVSVESFVRLISGQVFIASILGSNRLGAIVPIAALAIVFLLGIAVLAMGFIESTTPMRMLLAFSGLVFAASIFAPTEYPPPSQTEWPILTIVPGIRYWFFPCLCVVWSLLYGLKSSRQAPKLLAVPLALLMTIGVWRDFRYPPLPDMKFALHAEQLAAAAPGNTVTVPIPFNWSIVLIKH